MSELQQKHTQYYSETKVEIAQVQQTLSLEAGIYLLSVSLHSSRYFIALFDLVILLSDHNMNPYCSVVGNYLVLP